MGTAEHTELFRKKDINSTHMYQFQRQCSFYVFSSCHVSLSLLVHANVMVFLEYARVYICDNIRNMWQRLQGVVVESIQDSNIMLNMSTGINIQVLFVVSHNCRVVIHEQTAVEFKVAT